MSELDLNQIETIARNLRAVSDETYSAAVAVADVYNATSSYDIGDYCIKSTLLYKCNTAIPSGEVWNSNHWDEICVSDELNDIRGNVIHVGTSAPSNPNVQLWLDTDEPGMTGVSSVNGKTGTVVLDLDDIGFAELLWTNASPTSDFAAQTISLALSGYFAVLIEASANAANVYVNDYLITMPQSGTKTAQMATYVNYSAAQAIDIICRELTVSATGIAFAEGKQKTTNATSTSTSNNSRQRPLRIWGIKGVTA